MANFQKALAYIKPNEGGFVDNPHDPGGRTNWGITQKTLDHYREEYDPSFHEDVKDLTWEEATVIYYELYWLPSNLDPINDDRVASKIFDIYINLPPQKAIKIAQVSANAVSGSDLMIDGQMGPKTIAAINACDPDAFLGDLVSELSAYYLSLNKPEFIHGWLKRAARLPDD